jgi:hypothetical protein
MDKEKERQQKTPNPVVVFYRSAANFQLAEWTASTHEAQQASKPGRSVCSEHRKRSSKD